MLMSLGKRLCWASYRAGVTVKKVYPRPEATGEAGAITPGESHEARLYAGCGPRALSSHPPASRKPR